MKLKHACSLYADYGLNISADEYVDDGIPLLRTSDFDDYGKLKNANFKHVREAVASKKILKKGDILFSRAGTVGRCMIFDDDMAATFAAYLVRFRPSDKLAEPRFIFYWAQSQPYNHQIAVETIESTIGNFNGARFANLEFPEHDLDTQKTIAAFLDRETARIDQLIEKKQRLVALLEEKREREVDLHFRQLTERQRPQALRWLIRVRSGDFLSNHNFEQECSEKMPIPVVGGNGVLGFSNKSNVPAGTVVVGRVGALCGNIHLLERRSWVTDNALIVRNISLGLTASFLAFLLSRAGLNQIASRNAQPLITSENVKRLKARIPSVAKQDTFTDQLRHIQQNAAQLSGKISVSIDRLREFRAALITAAVTGRIDPATWRRRGDTDRRLDRIDEALAS